MGGASPASARGGRGACSARITSALRRCLRHFTHDVPPARLSAIRATALGAAQTGQTNGTSTGGREAATVSTT